MIQFHETGMGRKFFEGQIPRISKALEDIGKQLEEQNKNLKKNNDLMKQMLGMTTGFTDTDENVVDESDDKY